MQKKSGAGGGVDTQEGCRDCTDDLSFGGQFQLAHLVS